MDWKLEVEDANGLRNINLNCAKCGPIVHASFKQETATCESAIYDALRFALGHEHAHDVYDSRQPG